MNWLLTYLINPTCSKRTINQRMVRQVDGEELLSGAHTPGYPIRIDNTWEPAKRDIYYVSGIFAFMGRTYSMIFGAGDTPQHAWDIANQTVSLRKLLQMVWPHIVSRKKQIGPFQIVSSVDPITLDWTKAAQRRYRGRRQVEFDVDAAVDTFKQLQKSHRQ